MRIVFTSDLHGSALHYEQLETWLRAATPDVLILGGDLLPDGDRYNPLGTQVAYLEREFMPRMDAWHEAHPRMSVLCIAGNHEWACAWDTLAAHHAAGRIVLLTHERGWARDGVTFIGYSSTPPTPHWAKDFERLDVAGDTFVSSEGSIWDRKAQRVRDVELGTYFAAQPTVADELAQAMHPAGPWILVAHAPPIDTRLDRLPTIPHPIGSRAVRTFIEATQPLCALHGHLHESPEVTGHFCDRIGGTLCVNPGQHLKRLQAVVFDVEQPERTIRHTVFSK
jgi:uncharacterized protein